MFNSILTDVASTLSINDGLTCIISALIFGLVIALVHKITSNYNKNFLITLVAMPMLVAVIIMMVNGNLGTSVAVFGAFSLVRFRSLPGNSKEITSIFFAMTVGLAVGMGHIVFAGVIVIILSIILISLDKLKFGEKPKSNRILKITIPEDLDFDSVFDDIFTKYTVKSDLVNVRTTNMGSMYELAFDIKLADATKVKDFLDELRIRNGNLKIILSRNLTESEL